MRAELLAERLGQAFRFKVFLLPAHRTASMTIAAALCAGGSFPESSESKPLVIKRLEIRIGCFLEIEQSWFAQNYVQLVEKALTSSEPHSEPHVGEEAAKETCVPRCLARSRD